MVRMEWSTREKILVGVLVGAIVLFFAYTQWGKEEIDPASTSIETYQAAPVSKETNTPTKEKAPQEIVVDVKGAVKQPGIYQLSHQARVFQAIERAGGTLPTADLNQVNLAQSLLDGMVVYIPKKGEQGSGAWEGSATSSSSHPKKVNINQATAIELQQLTGVGPSKAEAIIKYREENGPFRSVDQLTQVPGIGEKTLEKFRDEVTS
ncbi:helix-hairpin-helix domain-containing protein [Hazenella coriacea]|uniref:Competence protein ComEA n=1 Tax=Hazenella coriacea TaxID=1179467 RepID=A0A4R3LBA2_9BACL|nr:helix-hairpin-helix domain-containing protein [Hazenella coriacea]TCS94796.1 competence protein ComEA [Hazenella coriacea]